MSEISSGGVEVGMYIETGRVEDYVDMEHSIDVVFFRKERP